MVCKNLRSIIVGMVVLAGVPLYGDNLITNPGFETGDTTGWNAGGCSIAVSPVSHSGSYGALVTNRSDTWSGIGQSLLGKLSDGQTCIVSAWIRIENAAEANVSATIHKVDDNGDNWTPVVWSQPCGDSGWTILSGFYTLEAAGTLSELYLYFEGPDPAVNYYVDDVSVTVTDNGNWQAEANQRIEQIRKGDFAVVAVSPHNPEQVIENVSVEVNQTRHHFAFGSAFSRNHIDNTDYLNFFKEHFEWAVCENASKWYANEWAEGNVSYADADAIYDFCTANDIRMRGHCLFWAAQNMVQNWVQALDYAPLPAGSQLRTAVENRLDSAVNHFKGKFLHWDINNEMCDNAFFADRLGDDIRPWMFQAAHAIDPDCRLFLNDYNIINGGYNLSDYKQMAYDLAAAGAPLHGLGVQCHMSSGFNPATIKARFDSIAEVGLPVWVTEFDVIEPNEYGRADQLENFYRVAFSHPAVEGILMWGFWEEAHWRENAHLVNADWTLNAAGQRYETLMDEWTTRQTNITDSNGRVDFRGFYGTYMVTLTPAGAFPTTTAIEVRPNGQTEFPIELDYVNPPTSCDQVLHAGYRLQGDLDGNCRVDLADVAILISQWLVCNNPQDDCIQNW